MAGNIPVDKQTPNEKPGGKDFRSRFWGKSSAIAPNAEVKQQVDKPHINNQKGPEAWSAVSEFNIST
jgi:hypothetical protein